MLPYLFIGGKRETFWKLNPKEISIDFKAYEMREKKSARERWEIGAYFRIALNSSILLCTIADKPTASKLPEFPKMPYSEEKSENTLTEEQLKAERLRTFLFFKTLRSQK